MPTLFIQIRSAFSIYGRFKYLKKILLTGFLLLYSLYTIAQVQTQGVLKGDIHNRARNPVSATVRLLPSSIAKSTDSAGRYIFNDVKPGNYSLEISAVGYQKLVKRITIKSEGINIQNVVLDEISETMKEVAILGITPLKEVGKQAYNVSSIDAKPLYNTTMDLGQVLTRVSGARVRESGGMGSDMRFSLNGFTGRQVKIFLDGIPMDNFGSSFQLNNIPVNFADRIEIYKGVVPIRLGGDALGGAVNIISNSKPRTYLDVSYSYGSFNTHKSALSAGFTAKSGLTFQMNAFQNYSDNNYWVNADVVDQVTGLNNPQRVKRFHDAYRNETLIGNLGVVDKKYADQLLIGIMLSKNRSDIQTGNRMYDVYGGRWRSGNIAQPTIKYIKKDLLVKGLDLRVGGNFNFGEERAVDTANKRYNWDGTFIYKNKLNPNAPGGENSLRDYRFRNNNGIASAGLSYQISDKHSISLNELYTTFDRKGQNSFDPDDIYDKQPRTTRKNTLGLGYKYDVSSKFNTSFFVKKYNQRIISNLVTATYDATYEDYNYSVVNRTSNHSKTGYGLAATYFLSENFQLKTSYERAYRLPDNNELFGDEINETSNITLKPENSYNLNLGATYIFNLGKVHYLDITANYIYRDASDYIRGILVPGGTTNSNGEYIQMNINEARVINRGIDAEIHYAYKKRLSLTASLTYQDLRNGTQFETLADGTRSTVENVVYKDRIPNTPYLFGNANGTFYLDHIFSPEDKLSISYNLGYVNQFYLFWPSQGVKDGKLTIPTQWTHDASLLYSVASGKYNIAFECLNLTDAKLYDNYMLQKPSRAFNLKLRYFFSKQRI